MRYLGVFVFVAIVLLILTTMIVGTGQLANAETDGHVMPRLEATRERLYRSYPAPTGEAGFRRYYQRRCYPGCHYGYAVVTPAAAADTHGQAEATPTRVRPYRSYPAPTGEAGFRRYYQKRCFPGCHYGDTVVTPFPTKIHP
jgi:hypothetical protein